MNKIRFSLLTQAFQLVKSPISTSITIESVFASSIDKQNTLKSVYFMII